MPQWSNAPWIQELWASTSPALAKIGGGLAILIGGWLVALVLRRVVYSALRRTSLDNRIARVFGVSAESDVADRVERATSTAVYYVVLLFVAIAFFSFLGIDAVTAPLVTLLNGFAGAVPGLLKAALIGLCGFLLAVVAKKLVATVLTKLDFDGKVQRLSRDSEAEEQAPQQPSATPTLTVAAVTFWLVLVLTVVPVLEALQVGALATPLSAAIASVALYLPKLLAAAILLAIGYVLGRLARSVVRTVLLKIGLDRAMERIGLGKLTGQLGLSGALGNVVMFFILVQFAISAIGRVGIEELSGPLTLMLDQIYVYLPKVLIAGLLLTVGIVLGKILGNMAAQLVAGFGLNSLMVRIGLAKAPGPGWAEQERSAKSSKSSSPVRDSRATEEDLFAKRAAAHTPADLVGVALNVVIVLLFLRQALGTLELRGLSGLLDGLLAYLPNVLAATVVLGAGLWAGTWAHRRTDELTRSATDRLTKALGSIVHIAVVAFAAMVSLQQLGVGEQLIAIAFGLLLGAVCLALALAFGLGGREVAGKLVAEEYGRRRRPGATRPNPDQ